MVLEAGKSEIAGLEHLVSGGSSLSGSQTACFSLCPHVGEGRGSCRVAFIRALIPFVRPPPPGSNRVPKAPPLNTIIVGGRVSTHQFLGRHNHSVNSHGPGSKSKEVCWQVEGCVGGWARNQGTEGSGSELGEGHGVVGEGANRVSQGLAMS